MAVLVDAEFSHYLSVLVGLRNETQVQLLDALFVVLLLRVELGNCRDQELLEVFDLSTLLDAFDSDVADHLLKTFLLLHHLSLHLLYLCGARSDSLL